MRFFDRTLILIAPVRRALAVAFAGVVLALAGCASTGDSPAQAVQQPKNIIIMFADGAASTQWDFGRYSSKVLRQQPFATTDVVFREWNARSPQHASTATPTWSIPQRRARRCRPATRSTTARWPSHRTASQFPRSWKRPRPAGKRIGLVTTATVYDATPAAFSLHAISRRDSQGLVDQYLALEPDVLMGGGADYFLPAGTPGGKRKDGKDIIAAFRAKGYQIARNTAELKAATGARLLGLFADEDMDFELDRDPAQGAHDRRDGRGRPQGAFAGQPERVRPAGRKREHRHRGARQRRGVAHARAVGVRRCGQGRARVSAPHAGHAGDHHRRSRDRRILPDLRAEGSQHAFEHEPLLHRRRAAADARAHHDVAQRR